MSTYKAILINPVDETFTDVTIDRSGELENLYGLLDCDLIETVSPIFGEPGDRIVCDEEGLFKEGQFFFAAPGGLRIVGKALYVGGIGSRSWS